MGSMSLIPMRFKLLICPRPFYCCCFTSYFLNGLMSRTDEAYLMMKHLQNQMATICNWLIKSRYSMNWISGNPHRRTRQQLLHHSSHLWRREARDMTRHVLFKVPSNSKITCAATKKYKRPNKLKYAKILQENMPLQLCFWDASSKGETNFIKDDGSVPSSVPGSHDTYPACKLLGPWN